MKAIQVYWVLLNIFIYGGGNGDKIYPRTTSSKDSMCVVVVALRYQHSIKVLITECQTCHKYSQSSLTEDSSFVTTANTMGNRSV